MISPFHDSALHFQIWNPNYPLDGGSLTLWRGMGGRKWGSAWVEWGGADGRAAPSWVNCDSKGDTGSGRYLCNWDEGTCLWSGETCSCWHLSLCCCLWADWWLSALDILCTYILYSTGREGPLHKYSVWSLHDIYRLWEVQVLNCQTDPRLCGLTWGLGGRSCTSKTSWPNQSTVECSLSADPKARRF